LPRHASRECGYPQSLRLRPQTRGAIQDRVVIEQAVHHEAATNAVPLTNVDQPKRCAHGLAVIGAAPLEQEPRPFVVMARLDGPACHAWDDGPIGHEVFADHAGLCSDKAREREIADLIAQRSPTWIAARSTPRQPRLE